MRTYNFNKAVNEAFDFNNIENSLNDELSNVSSNYLNKNANIKATVSEELQYSKFTGFKVAWADMLNTNILYKVLRQYSGTTNNNIKFLLKKLNWLHTTRWSLIRIYHHLYKLKRDNRLNSIKKYELLTIGNDLTEDMIERYSEESFSEDKKIVNLLSEDTFLRIYKFLNEQLNSDPNGSHSVYALSGVELFISPDGGLFYLRIPQSYSSPNLLFATDELFNGLLLMFGYTGEKIYDSASQTKKARSKKDDPISILKKRISKSGLRVGLDVAETIMLGDKVPCIYMTDTYQKRAMSGGKFRYTLYNGISHKIINKALRAYIPLSRIPDFDLRNRIIKEMDTPEFKNLVSFIDEDCTYMWRCYNAEWQILFLCILQHEDGESSGTCRLMFIPFS